MKTLKEWLPDEHALMSGNVISPIMGNLWDVEVESVWHARSLYNCRLDIFIQYLQSHKFSFANRIKRLVESGVEIPE